MWRLSNEPIQSTIKFPKRKKIEFNSIKQPNLLIKIIKIWYLISFVIKTIKTEGLIFHFFRSKSILRFSKSAKTNQKNHIKENFPIVWTINIFFFQFLHPSKTNKPYFFQLYYLYTFSYQIFFYHLINFPFFALPIPSLDSVENEKNKISNYMKKSVNLMQGFWGLGVFLIRKRLKIFWIVKWIAEIHLDL